MNIYVYRLEESSSKAKINKLIGLGTSKVYRRFGHTPNNEIEEENLIDEFKPFSIRTKPGPEN
jgi:hypothetical protein